MPFDYLNSAQAVLLMNETVGIDGKKRMSFVIKNRYCSNCTSQRSCYNCMIDRPGKEYLQDLGSFEIFRTRYSDKVSIMYTGALIRFPQIDRRF